MSDILKTDLTLKNGQIKTVSGIENLKQVIEHKLLTRKGELTNLGHPKYGSRLHLLIGEPETKRTRALADFYIRESLADEKRIKEIVSISIKAFSMQADKRSKLFITIIVRPVDENDTIELNITLE